MCKGIVWLYGINYRGCCVRGRFIEWGNFIRGRGWGFIFWGRGILNLY